MYSLFGTLWEAHSFSLSSFTSLFAFNMKTRDKFPILWIMYLYRKYSASHVICYPQWTFSISDCHNLSWGSFEYVHYLTFILLLPCFFSNLSCEWKWIIFKIVLRSKHDETNCAFACLIWVTRYKGGKKDSTWENVDETYPRLERYRSVKLAKKSRTSTGND